MRMPKVARVGRAVMGRIALLVMAFGLLVGCVTEPMTGRSQFALITEGQANQMGVQAYQDLLEKAPVSRDAKTIAMVERVGRRIAKITDQHMAEEGRQLYNWEFTVIDDPKTVNAFALPGGKVAVYTGILPVAQDENGLAVVMGHEVAHAFAQHGRKRVSESVITQFGLGVADAFLNGEGSSAESQAIYQALGVGVQFGVTLPFSRSDESAADEIGLMLMAEAGYDPRAAAPFWQRMEALSEGAPPEFLSTHPASSTRVQNIQEHLPEALERYQQSGGGAVQ